MNSLLEIIKTNKTDINKFNLPAFCVRKLKVQDIILNINKLTCFQGPFSSQVDYNLKFQTYNQYSDYHEIETQRRNNIQSVVQFLVPLLVL